MQKYAHIQVESQADVLTKAQGFLKMSETDLSTNLYNSDDDYIYEYAIEKVVDKWAIGVSIVVNPTLVSLPTCEFDWSS